MFLFTGDAPTRSAETVDSVMLYIVAISVILLVGVTATMIYFVFRYHRKKGHKPVDIEGNVWLEIIWIGIPTILVLTMFYYSYSGFRIIRNIPEDSFQINVIAKMWEWDFKYDNGKNVDTLYVPLGKPIKLLMESLDVNHSLYIPAFRLKEDVIAGRINYMGFTPEKVGEYDIACAEYCGLNHSMMYTKVVVMPEEEFNLWYNSTDSDSANKKISSPDSSKNISSVSYHSNKEDMKLLFSKGCLSCHSLDGSEGVAPTFKGLYNREVVVSQSGYEKKIIADENYIRKSITDPNEMIVAGYKAGLMPDLEYLLDDDEVNQIVEILKGID